MKLYMLFGQKNVQLKFYQTQKAHNRKRDLIWIIANLRSNKQDWIKKIISRILF